MTEMQIIYALLVIICFCGAVIIRDLILLKNRIDKMDEDIFTLEEADYGFTTDKAPR